MNTKILATIVSLLASICFFVSYFKEKETITLVLGCAWVTIAILNFISLKKEKKK